MRNEGRHACAALVLTALASGTSAVETPGRLRAQGKESVYAYAELAKGREVFDAFRALAPGAELRYRLYPHPPRQGVGLAWRDGGGTRARCGWPATTASPWRNWRGWSGAMPGWWPACRPRS